MSYKEILIEKTLKIGLEVGSLGSFFRKTPPLPIVRPRKLLISDLS